MNPLSVYIDANALIEAVERPASRLLGVLKRLKLHGTMLASSELSLAEALTKPMQQDDVSLVAIYDDMIGPGGLVTAIPIDRRVLRRSAEIRARLGGKLPDAIHVATAILTGCTVVLSSDKRLQLPPGLRRVSAGDAPMLEEPQ